MPELHPTGLTSTAFVARPTPIYVFGDSHGLIFSDLVFEEKRFFRRHFITRAHYLPGLSASSFTQNKNSLDTGLVHALIGAGLIDARLRPTHLTSSETGESVARATDRGRSEPILLLFVGDIDLRSVLLKQLGEDVDFILPFAGPDSAFAHVEGQALRGKPVPFSLVGQMIEKLLAPLVLGLGFLRQLGFQKMFVHSLPPPTLSDAEFVRINGYRTPLALRYKASMAFNRQLAQKCSQLQIGFIDLWPQVTENDRLRPEFQLDHVHLNRKAALLSISQLIDQLPQSHNYALNVQYERLQRHVAEHHAVPPALPEVREAFAARHIYQDEKALSRTDVDALLALLGFEHDVGNRHFRFDWVGNTVRPFSDKIRVAEPTPAVMQELHRLLYGEQVRAIIESCMGTPYSVICCRMFHSLAHQEPGTGPQAFHTDQAPPGIIRAIVYLTDVDEGSGPFEYLDPATGESRLVTGPAGSLHVFDANALRHRGSPPTLRERKVLDLVLAPLMPGFGERVLWPGMNHWPVDPFHYSVDGFLACPMLDQELINASLAAPAPPALLQRFEDLYQQDEHAEIVALYQQEFDALPVAQRRWLPGLYALAMALLAQNRDFDPQWLRQADRSLAGLLPPGPLRAYLQLQGAPAHPVDPQLAAIPHALVLLEQPEQLMQVPADMHQLVLVVCGDFGAEGMRRLEAACQERGDDIWLVQLDELSAPQLANMFRFAGALVLPPGNRFQLRELRLLALLEGRRLILLPAPV